MSPQRLIRRFVMAWHYANNPGGMTHRAKAIRRTREETHAMLRREVTERLCVEAVRNALSEEGAR